MMQGNRIPVVAALMLLLAVGGLHAADDMSCGAAAAWVESHAGPLPSTYEEIATYPPAYRRALFAALPAAGKSRVWRAHLESWIKSQTNLGADHLAIVEEAMSFLGTDMFQVMDDPKRSQVHEDRLWDLQQRALNVLTPAQLRQAFMDLGSLQPAALVIDIDEVELKECDCATGPAGQVQACPKGTSCKDVECKNDSGRGCGLFHYVPCHGICMARADDIIPIEVL